MLSGSLVLFAILATGGFVPGGMPALHAQSWEARLEIAAFPSPYLSDWESNPSIGRLTISNPTSADQNVVLAYRVSGQGGRILASGRSTPILVPRGAPTVISDFVNLSGSSQHDQQLESEMRRTGRLPEGDNTTCVSVTDVSGFVLDEDCVTFSIVYPDPPYLIGPLDEAALTSGHPIFQWTPLQVPPAFQLSYVVRVSEVLQGQAPLQALVANIPVFEATTRSTTLEYPLGALPLVPGKAYAWRVQALDQNGYAASTGEGRSEVWTFTLPAPAETGPSGGSSYVTLSVANTRTGGATADETSEGFMQICRNWTATDPVRPNTRIQLGLNSPIGFPSNLALRAQLHRHEVPGTNERYWALVGNHNDKRLMLYGDCNGPTDLVPWPHWLGIRSIAGTAPVEFLMGGDTSLTDSSYTDNSSDLDTTRRLKFGAVFFALQPQTAAAPPGFEIVRAFLEDNEVDVGLGVTAFGIYQLEERPFWRLFQAFGYQNKEITLRGFAGVDMSLSYGFGADSRTGGSRDVSAELEFVNLTAALPARTPGPLLSSLFSSMQLEFEFAITDTVSRGRAAGDRVHHQFHAILNLNHRMTLNDNVITALRMNPGAEFVSTTGLDLSTEEFNRGSTELKLVRRYSLDASWNLFGTQLVVANPQLEIGLLLAGPNRGDLMFTLLGEAGWGSQDGLGRIALTLARSDAVARSHQPTVALDRMHANITRWQERLEYTQQQLAGASTDAEREQLQGYITQYNGWIAEEQEQVRSFESLNAMRRARQNQEAVVAAQPTCLGRLRGWFCSFRLSLGNMNPLDLVSLIREIGFEVTN